MTISDMARFTSMSLLKPPMASPQCSDMLPMTTEEEWMCAQYRNDCVEKNRRNRYAWETKSVALACIGETDVAKT